MSNSNEAAAEPETLADVIAEILSRLERLEGDRSGVWLTYYGDWSGAAVFPTELEALRYAQARSMLVEFRQWGDLR